MNILTTKSATPFQKTKCLLLVAILMSVSCVTLAKGEDKKSPVVNIVTDLGAFKVQLNRKKAPVTVENFINYVESGYYVGTIFHRVIPGFVVQGGGLNFDFTSKKTNDPIVNESRNKLKNNTGTIAMARTQDPDSATSQFYINLKDNDALNQKSKRPGYTVFGKVIEGMDIVKKIEKQPRGIHRAHPDAPNYPIRILKTEIIK